MKYFIGIDVGLKGAIAIINTVYNTEEIIDMPLYENRVVNVLAINDLLQKEIPEYDIHNAICYIEQPFSSPIEGTKRARISENGLARIQACLELLGIQYKMIRAQEWQKYYDLIQKDGEKIKQLRKQKKLAKDKKEIERQLRKLNEQKKKIKKQKSIELAQSLYPTSEINNNDNRAEALLIAKYAQENF